MSMDEAVGRLQQVSATVNQIASAAQALYGVVQQALRPSKDGASSAASPTGSAAGVPVASGGSKSPKTKEFEVVVKVIVKCIQKWVGRPSQKKDGRDDPLPALKPLLTALAFITNHSKDLRRLVFHSDGVATLLRLLKKYPVDNTLSPLAYDTVKVIISNERKGPLVARLHGGIKVIKASLDSLKSSKGATTARVALELLATMLTKNTHNVSLALKAGIGPLLLSAASQPDKPKLFLACCLVLERMVEVPKFAPEMVRIGFIPWSLNSLALLHDLKKESSKPIASVLRSLKAVVALPGTVLSPFLEQLNSPSLLKLVDNLRIKCQENSAVLKLLGSLLWCLQTRQYRTMMGESTKEEPKPLVDDAGAYDEVEYSVSHAGNELLSAALADTEQSEEHKRVPVLSVPVSAPVLPTDADDPDDTGDDTTVSETPIGRKKKKRVSRIGKKRVKKASAPAKNRQKPAKKPSARSSPSPSPDPETQEDVSPLPNEEEEADEVDEDDEADVSNTDASVTASAITAETKTEETGWSVMELCPELWGPAEKELYGSTQLAFAQGVVHVRPWVQLKDSDGKDIAPRYSDKMEPRVPLSPPTSDAELCRALEDSSRFQDPDSFRGDIVYDRTVLEGRDAPVLPQMFASASPQLPDSVVATLLNGESITNTSLAALASPTSPSLSPTSGISPLDATPSAVAQSAPTDTRPDVPIRALSFDSRFESANLHRAIRVGPAEYDLILSADINSSQHGHTQWFYFMVGGITKGVRYRFNIVNLEKSYSVFSAGMKPSMFSRELYQTSRVGWHRAADATDVVYYHNCHRRFIKEEGGLAKQKLGSTRARDPKGSGGEEDGRDSDDSDSGNEEKTGAGGVEEEEEKGAGLSLDDSELLPQDGDGDGESDEDMGVGPADAKTAADISLSDKEFMYTLSFSMTFPCDDDVVYLAHCYPYTYSMMKRHLASLSKAPGASRIVRRQLLCKSRGGNDCEVVTITDFTATPEQMRERQLVVLSARVHPGEVTASWNMKGVLDFLAGPTADAQLLRRRLVFKLIPMLNPDGVINGNYRCGLSGVDLNRNYQNPDVIRHPTVFHLKRMVLELAKTRPLLLYCDFHSHSKMKNFCLYGSDPEDAKSHPPPLPDKQTAMPVAFPILPTDWRGRCRVLSYLLARRAPSSFGLQFCRYNISRVKQSSARVVFWRELRGHFNCFTLESSFCSAVSGELSDVHFGILHFEQMGVALAKAVADFVSQDQSAVKLAVDQIAQSLGTGKREKKSSRRSSSVSASLKAAAVRRKSLKRGGSRTGSLRSNTSAK